jgi:hypothetical protein
MRMGGGHVRLRSGSRLGTEGVTVDGMLVCKMSAMQGDAVCPGATWLDPRDQLLDAETLAAWDIMSPCNPGR